MKTKTLLLTLAASMSFATTTFAQNFWQTINSPNINASTVAMIAAKNGNILASDAGTNNRNEYSTNNGNTWNYCTGTAFHSPKFIVKANGDLYASGDYFVKSTDNGVTYTVQGSIGATNLLSDFVINSSGDIFALSHDGNNLSGAINHSADNGVTWDTVNVTFVNPASNPLCIAINSSDEIFVGTTPFGTGGGQIFRSTDNGVTFTAVSGTTFSNNAINRIVINSSDEIYTATGLGMYRSLDNGTTWTAINSGLPSTAINNFILIGSGTIFTSISNKGVFRSADKGNSWTDVSSGLQSCGAGCFRAPTAFAIDAAGYLYAGTNDFGTYRSGASTFTGIETIDKPDAVTVFPNPTNGKVAINRNGGNIKSIEIYNILGETIYRLPVTDLSRTEGRDYRLPVTIDLSSHPAGIYFVKLVSGDKIAMQKIILE